MKGIKEAFIDAGEISQMLGIGMLNYSEYLEGMHIKLFED